MIFFVWSLISSAIEAARKREIVNFLTKCLIEQQTSRCTDRLRWKTIQTSTTPSSSHFHRRLSEPRLDRHRRLVLQTDHLQVFAEKFETLRAADWRFSPTFWPNNDDTIYFIVDGELKTSAESQEENSDDGDDDVLKPTFFDLYKRCDRLATHRTMTKSIFACSLMMFSDVIEAFSDHLLMDDQFNVYQIYSMFAPPNPNEMTMRTRRRVDASSTTSSMVSLTSMRQRTLPILQHLFWGDDDGEQVMTSERVDDRYGSDGALNRNDRMLMLRMTTTVIVDPQFNRRGSTNQISIDRLKKLCDDSGSSIDEFRSLPRSYRHLPPTTKNGGGGFHIIDSSNVPRFIRQINLALSSEDVSKSESARLPTTSDSFSSSLMEEAEENGKSTGNSYVDDVTIIDLIRSDELKMIDETDTDTNDSVSESTMAKTMFTPPPPPLLRNRRSISAVTRNDSNTTNRRFSALSNEFDRTRSVSPSFQYYQNRSLRGFTKAANQSRNSTRSLNFLTSRQNTKGRAMAKPDSVLVYTAGDEDLYSKIRQRLSQLLPVDEITVFNVSIEALQKQPWNEKSTICVILASTKNLDDEAWNRIQKYFNNNGKIIFVCQNKLLASVTGSDSTKENSSIIRFFGKKDNKLKENNKEFAKFLEKNLKTLLKKSNSKIDETFKSKSGSVGANFKVVLKKDEDSPLFLYMQNSGSLHASVLFSDATTQQLLAPDSNLLKDSLKSVGVRVENNETPVLTKGIMISEFDSIIEEIQGLRLGEQIGTRPELILRKREIVEKQGLPKPTQNLLPIEVLTRDHGRTVKWFDLDNYFEAIKTKIGQVLVIVDVATTTMDICESISNAIPSLKSFVVIANRQISGKGRGGNEFISPLGSALFTFTFTLPKASRFAKNVPILQHVFCAALVDATRKLSGYSDFPLRIKWPNDLYYERSHKLGGMLITCKNRDDAFLISIGCGINVSNEKPTICLNDMLPKGSEIKFTKEMLIAETLNRFQYLINDYETNGPALFRKKYYDYWLHSNEEVLLSDFNERVVIRGIDDYGYLQVRSKTKPEKIFSIGDDGNTFDMMKGLIRHKY